MAELHAMPATPTTIELYYVFLASPSDVQSERQHVRNYFNRFNQWLAHHWGIRLELVDFENFTTIGVGRPQEIITRQTLERCREHLVLVIGVMNQRFGSPSGVADSGTEEEFNTALQFAEEHGYPEIKWFFRTRETLEIPAEIEPAEKALNQWKKVLAFKDRVDQERRVWADTYSDETEFREVLERDLDRWMMQPERPWHERTRNVMSPEYLFPISDAAEKSAAQVPLEIVLEQYRLYVSGRSGDIRPMGLGQGFNLFRLPTRDAYVHLEATFSGLGGVDRNRQEFGAFESEPNLPFTHLFTLVHQKWGGRAALAFGVAGAGKTTGAKKLAWSLASGEVGPVELGLPEGTIPLWLPFREMDEDAVQGDPDWSHPLEAFLVREARFAPIGIEGDLIDAGPDLIESPSPLLWIFDGLDELPTEGLRILACGWLLELHKRRPSDFFLVTSRYFGDQAAEKILVPHFHRFDVVALKDELQQDFVHNYFQSRNRYEAHGLSRDEIEARAHHFYKELKELELSPDADSKLPELAGNPLFLSILCFVYEGKDGVLPRQRCELYRHCVEVLVIHWRENVNRSSMGEEFNADLALELLAALAWWLQDSSERVSAPRSELAAISRSLLDQNPGRVGLPRDGNAFLTLMLEHCGIMTVTGGAGRLGFLHLRLQEYLAAVYVVKLERGPAELVQRYLATHTEDRWREVIALSIRMGSEHFCEQLFEGLLFEGVDELGEDEASFVGRCLAELEPDCLRPFVRVFEDPQVSDRRKTRLLRMFLARESQQLRGLIPVVHSFVDNPEIRTVALEILRRVGEPVRQARTTVASEVLDLTWTDPRTGINYVRVEPGEFRMGEGESAKIVVIEAPFYLGQYAVTNQLFRKFLRDSGYQMLEQPRFWSEPRFNGDQQPIVGITWSDAAAFCEWAGGELPSEAQWEYACRAGTETHFSFGDDEEILPEYGWFEENSGNKTHDVGLKEPNPWGLYDMHGNVWEWCRTETGYIGSNRVTRGGAWNNAAFFCRSAYGIGRRPALQMTANGFRPQIAIKEVKEG